MMVDFIFMQSGTANQHQLDCLSLSYVGSVNTILKIGYTPPAPAIYMFTPNIIKKYNRIFNFLLKIRLVQKAIDLNLRKINNKEARKYIGHICHIVEVLQSFLYAAVILPMSTRNWLHHHWRPSSSFVPPSWDQRTGFCNRNKAHDGCK